MKTLNDHIHLQNGGLKQVNTSKASESFD